jgi:hypothetical protein
MLEFKGGPFSRFPYFLREHMLERLSTMAAR